MDSKQFLLTVRRKIVVEIVVKVGQQSLISLKCFLISSGVIFGHFSVLGETFHFRHFEHGKGSTVL
jgi:hypothetical protein